MGNSTGAEWGTGRRKEGTCRNAILFGWKIGEEGTVFKFDSVMTQQKDRLRSWKHQQSKERVRAHSRLEICNRQGKTEPDTLEEEVWKESCVSSKLLMSNMGRYRMMTPTGTGYGPAITAKAAEGRAYAARTSGGKVYEFHRLVYCSFFGEDYKLFPFLVDHIDRDKRTTFSFRICASDSTPRTVRTQLSNPPQRRGECITKAVQGKPGLEL